MSEKPNMRLVEREKPKRKSDDEYIRDHKDSLLHLLIKESPERAQMIIDKLLGKREAA